MTNKMITGTAALLGLVALVLRRQLYGVALDEKGLLLRGHPLSLALLVLTAAVMLLIVLCICRLRIPENHIPAGMAAGFGHAAMAAGILSVVLPGMPMMRGYLGTVWQWLAMGSPVCLLAAGAVRLWGKKPFFLLHMLPSLFFAVHIVNHYQGWSGNPQLQDYVFALLATVALVLFSFYNAAWEAGCGSRRMVLVTGQAAVYLCLAELGHSSEPLLYLGGSIWAATDLLSLRAMSCKEGE